eukprot:TRINITY_DN3759_c0_g1_i8.p1 TRINITY_DN3759_c0_g1~~TRINITY_DN3759_c0_g1_i8.p1  ORF type:complete len:211 (+),score=28.38 TRINITY_DN3759_c0_g1_i8:37-633(+)
MSETGAKSISLTKRKRFDFLDKQFSGYKKSKKNDEKEKQPSVLKTAFSTVQDRNANRIDQQPGNEAIVYTPLNTNQNQKQSGQQQEVLIDVLEKIMSAGKNRQEARYMIQDRFINKYLNLDNPEQSYVQNQNKKQKNNRKLHLSFKKTRLTSKKLKQLDQNITWEVAQKLSSGQTLGVKAQRFRGHTSPHRNVKEKKT